MTHTQKSLHGGCRLFRAGTRADRHSEFGAWYEGKSFMSRSETEGGANLHRGFATPTWVIFTISLRDAADFSSGCVATALWRWAPRRPLLLSGEKIQPRHARNLNVDRPYGMLNTGRTGKKLVCQFVGHGEKPEKSPCSPFPSRPVGTTCILSIKCRQGEMVPVRARFFGKRPARIADLARPAAVFLDARGRIWPKASK